MPGARTKPVPASESSASDEASQLEQYLQRQLEEDVARIFDESIHSDLEVVCGKLKILTHSCILKARTNTFYHKLETILHVDIEKNTFDEIYSFISDAYTECNIKHQEKEILTYLDHHLTAKSALSDTWIAKQDTEESEGFATPTCSISPFIEKGIPKSLNTSPSTELTKEYYALVPIEVNLLEKELQEQDVLSNAFHSIIKTQTEDLNKTKVLSHNKPTSLSLSSSHTSETIKHSNSYDIISKCCHNGSIAAEAAENNVNVLPSQTLESENKIEKSNNCEEKVAAETVPECVYSPDSLVADDPSSSSDYLSVVYTYSPGVSSSGCHLQINVGDSITIMENITSSDSGLENTGLFESLSSHRDVTLTDVSLTESTLHDLTADDSKDSFSSSLAEKNHFQRGKFATSVPTTSTSSSSDKNCSGECNEPIKVKDTVASKSSKEEKQRQNEEIVILESSSLSSETGSWESIFPPKLNQKEVCEKFIVKERQYSNEVGIATINENNSNYTDICSSLVQKSPFKSTSCFIDAASLLDEEDDTITVQDGIVETAGNVISNIFPAPSKPLPCSTVKVDLSPNDWSEGNENEDSLEQLDNKDPDSIQKDLSPTIFEMTPITEDSLSTNVFESAAQSEKTIQQFVGDEEPPIYAVDKEKSHLSTSTVFVSNTPHNSILSLKASSLKQYESEDSENDGTLSREDHTKRKLLKKYNESSPIVSGGASIEDYLPQIGSHVGSPSIRRKIENIPIVSGAYSPQIEDNKPKKSPKPSCAPAWVVDMSSSIKLDAETSVPNTGVRRPGDRACDYLKNESKHSSLENCNKSRSSVDSDSSEKSSHKFYIDLSSLPDPITPQKNKDTENVNEKKNMFSMYIDLGEKSTLREMPARLSSSLNTKKNLTGDSKQVSKTKPAKETSNECLAVTLLKNAEPNSTSTFETYESLCNDPNISILEIISLPEHRTDNVPNTKKLNSDSEAMKLEKQSLCIRKDDCTRITAVIEKEEPMDLFVKLSDLDKPVQKAETSWVINEEKVLDVRMTRSIPDNNWGDQSNAGASRSIEVISSFHSENALSLNRLFPHLKNEFSRSMPGSLSGRTRSPLRLGTSLSPGGDIDEHASDVSEISSVQSSFCRSVVENSTTEDTSQTSSLIGNCQSRLGQDLLRMFLEEIAPDVIVEVSGRRIKAHKCILSSRCQYFAGILSGGWVESAGNVIVLPPFSFNVVHFALCHIYSGVSTIPDSISIVELATIADMLGLEGLKEAIMFTLKSKYCHHFHRPCPVCTAGVLECFPLSSVYGLDDLYRKCLRWITKYFSKVWSTKAFATLPKELLDKCYQQHILNLSTDNLVETVCGCGIIVASLHNSRWAEIVARMCRRLVNAAAHFAAPRLVAVLRAVAPLAGEVPAPAKQALDDCLAAAIEWSPPDEACHAYAFLSALVKEIRSQHYSKPDLITNGNPTKVTGQNNLLYTHAGSWRLQCEGALVRSAPRVVGTQAFKDLPADLRKRLRELGCIMYGAQAIPVTSPFPDRKTRSTYHSKGNKVNGTAATRSLDIDHVRASFVPYVPKPAVTAGSLEVLKSTNDLRDKKSNRLNPPKVRTTKAQEERAKFNLTKNNQSGQERAVNKTSSSRVISFENTKPRYLESRKSKEGERKLPAAKKLIPKMISSSESSRNSSPIQARNLRTNRVKSRQTSEAKAQALSQDSLTARSRPRTAEPSTDSLSESQNSNKYATYTKTKHTTKGSIESVKNRPSDKRQTAAAHSSVNSRIKTKIPVYLNQGNKNYNTDVKQNGESQKRIQQPVKVVDAYTCSTNSVFRNTNERKVHGSLMNATKSSSAKVVPKIIKESLSSKSTPKQPKRSTNHAQRHEEHGVPPDIPVMERSGTFLKDEPTFGDKTTNIDIDQ